MNATRTLVEALHYDAASDDYQPHPADVKWLASLLRSINNGGMWATTEGVFQVDHKNKVLVYSPLMTTGQIYYRTKKIAPRLGYEVRLMGEEPDRSDEQSFAE